MTITEVRIKLVPADEHPLVAFAEITLGGWVIKELKLLKGVSGYFVNMPSRRITDRCHNCHSRNPLRARFCWDCGIRLPDARHVSQKNGKDVIYADIVHPINSECRQSMTTAIVVAYHAEVEASKLPGYVSSWERENTGTHQ